MQPRFGFREHAHTADWELEVWAPDLPALLEQATRGMYALSGMQLAPGHPQPYSVTLHGTDAESLLVQFLTELLWVEQERNLGFDDFHITVGVDFSLHADLRGRSIARLDKEIKAVTYHNLAVQHTLEGLRVNIVFDV